MNRVHPGARRVAKARVIRVSGTCMLAPARPGAGRRLQDPRQRRVGWFWKPERSGHAAEGLVGTPHQILVGDVQRADEPGLAEAHP